MWKKIVEFLKRIFLGRAPTQPWELGASFDHVPMPLPCEQGEVVDLKGLHEVSEILEKASVLAVIEPDKSDPGQLTPHFHIDEFACRDAVRTPVPSKYVKNVRELAENLEVLREALGGKQIIIGSGYRTAAHNKKVGGVKNSLHLTAAAVGIRVKGVSPAKVALKIKLLIKDGKMKPGGVGLYKNFVRYDCRGKFVSWSV